MNILRERTGLSSNAPKISAEMVKIWTAQGFTKADFPRLAAELAANLADPTRLFRAPSPGELARLMGVPTPRRAPRRIMRLFVRVARAVRKAATRTKPTAATSPVDGPADPPRAHDALANGGAK
jgi:hypothetical protein